MKVFLLFLSIVILSGVTSAKPAEAKEKDKLLDALLALQQEEGDDGEATKEDDNNDGLVQQDDKESPAHEQE